MSRSAGLVAAGVIAAVGLAAILWTARHAPESSLRSEAVPLREIADMTSRTVRIPKRPVRILSLCTSATDALLALGEAGRLVAIDEFSRVVPGTEHAAVVGKGSAVSREQVAALGVDLAFVWWYQDDAAAVLEDLGVPVVRIRSGRAAELPGMIRLVGDCVNCREAAEKSAEPVAAFLAKAPSQPRQDAKRAFVELYGPLKTVGRDTYTNDVLELAGLRNVADDTKGTVLFSAERLVQADPDVILVVGRDADRAALASRPGMAELRAVRGRQVFALDRYWLVAGPRMPQSIEKIRRTLSQSPSS